MVIDDHHIGLQRLLARLIDMTGLPVCAVRAQAIVFGRGDQRHNRRALVQRRHLGQITSSCGARPALHFSDSAQHLRVLGCGAALTHALQPVYAQIRCPPLQARHAQRQTQTMHQTRQITCK